MRAKGMKGTVEVIGSVTGGVQDELNIRGEIQDELVLRGESTIPTSVLPKHVSYNILDDKPEINAVEVKGQKLAIDYKLQDKMDVLTTQEIERILYLN